MVCLASPTTDNKALGVINGIISALISGGEKAAEAYIVALDPALLGIPIINWIIDEGVGYLATIVSVAGQKFADALVIDIQTKQEGSNVITATTALAIAQASNDQKAIDAAIKAASSAYKTAFNLDGWSTPS